VNKDLSPVRFFGLWLLTFLGFPIGGTLAFLVVGPALNPLTALFSGSIAGSVIGLGQWLVLRNLKIGPVWIAVTGPGLGLGLAASMALIGTDNAANPLAMRGIITGLVMGVMQWLVLRQSLPSSMGWPPIMSAAWAIGWTVTRLVGVDLSAGWANFGASGALVFSALTGGMLMVLTRANANRSLREGV
jgi:uncharacterized membrane protein YjfL (UPF0719 family)